MGFTSPYHENLTPLDLVNSGGKNNVPKCKDNQAQTQMKPFLLKSIKKMCFTLCSFQYHRGELRLYDVTFENAGMYQCIAENTHGAIYANAELKILGQYYFWFLLTISKKATC